MTYHKTYSCDGPGCSETTENADRLYKTNAAGKQVRIAGWWSLDGYDFHNLECLKAWIDADGEG